MSWRKNWISYLIWFVYTAAVGSSLVGLCISLCTGVGSREYWGLATELYAVAVGGMVFLLCKLAPRIATFAEKRKKFLSVLEAVLAVCFLVVGFVIRVRGIDEVEPISDYYDIARVAAGLRIPQLVHGADYLYLQLLNVLFVLVGNYFIAGIWIQIVLQLVGAILMFFALRRLAGPFPAMTALAFCMCAPYMIRYSLSLSPELLYFVLLSLVALLVATGAKGRLDPVFFLFTGILAAVCAYFDMIGMILLFLAVTLFLKERTETADFRRKLFSAIFCLLGFLLGFLVCFFMDSLLSGKSFYHVAGAWFALYRPGEFHLPAEISTAGSGAENFILLGLLTVGIFSFWHDKRKDHISLWVIMVCCIALGGCYGVFTEEMPGFYYLYLLCTVLAGIGLGQCFYVSPEGNFALAGEEAHQRRKKQEEDLKLEDLDMAVAEQQEREQALRQEKERKEQDGVQRLEPEAIKQTQYIENPLPLPKKHVKRVMEYSVQDIPEDDDFDYPVSEDDDFDR